MRRSRNVSKAASLVVVAGCATSLDGGVLTHPEGRPKCVSGSRHIGFGGGGPTNANELLALSIDTRVDVASGGSRWAAGGSILGGIGVPGCFLDARIGLWRAIVSGADEAKAVPSFELGAYI